MLKPSQMMKLMSAKNQFTANHPKFVAFCKAAFGSGIEEGTIIEISVTNPNNETITSNLRVLQSDLELMNELKSMM